MKREYSLLKLLKKHKLTLSLAESCTGGLIAKAITDIPGSSEIFKYGVVSYSNESKQKILKVRKNTLKRYGAVSEHTAREMAEGVQKILSTDISAAVTGIAGPGGGMPDKPVGTVYIGITIFNKTSVYKFKFSGSREQIREQTKNKTLNLIYKGIKETIS